MLMLGAWPSLCWTWWVSFLWRGGCSLLDHCCAGDSFNQWEVWVVFLQSCVWSLMVRLFHGVWSEGLLRMGMELWGAPGGLLWWLLGYELVACSTGLDLQIGIAVFALRGVVVQPRRNQWSERNLAPPGGFSPDGRQWSWSARWSRH
jgi:hypothetical protein